MVFSFFVSIDRNIKYSYNTVTMNSNGVLGKLLHSFERYYNISTENIESPFSAEAVFKSHNEQYFLVKAAKLADIDSNDFVYFFENDGGSESSVSDVSLSAEKLSQIADEAWKRGLARVNPYYGHRNSDVTLIVLSDRIDDESFKKIQKLNLYKSYKFGLYGWSAFRLMAYETSTGRVVTNRRGSDLKKLVNHSAWAKAS